MRCLGDRGGRAGPLEWAMDSTTRSPLGRRASAGRARLHPRRARALLRWGILLPLAIGFALIGLNAVLMANGIDRIAVRDAARFFVALPLGLGFVLGCAYVVKM